MGRAARQMVQAIGDSEVRNKARQKVRRGATVAIRVDVIGEQVYRQRLVDS